MAQNPFLQGLSRYDEYDDGPQVKAGKNPFLQALDAQNAARKKREEEEEANRNFAEEARKKQEEERKKAAKKKDDGKNILQKAGDVAGAVGNFVKDAAVDVKDTAVGAYTGVKDTIEGSVAANEQSKLQEGANEIQNKRNKEINDIYGKYIDSGVVAEDGGADESRMAKEDLDKINKLRSQRDGELQSYKKETNFDEETKNNRKEVDESQSVDAVKTGAQAAETFLNVATLGVGTAGKQAIKQGVKQGVKAALKTSAKNITGQGAKGLAKQTGLDATIGGAFGLTQTLKNDNGELGLDDYAKNILLGASIGAAVPVVIKGGQKAAGVLDKKAGQAVAKAGSKSTAAMENEAMQRSLKQIGEDGIVGTLNKSLSRAGTRAGYALEDTLNKTKVGSKVVDIKDDFMVKWVTEFHPLYKTLKRSDFEGQTEGAYLAAREAIGNSNRSLSYAQDFIETNPNMQKLTASLAARDKDLIKARMDFDEFAKVKSDLDLVATGKKKFSDKKMQELNGRMAKFEGKGFDEEYSGLVDFYKDLNKFRVDNGLMSKEMADQFEKEGFDYIRQQREIPDWMLDKPAAKGRGSAASITGSDAVQTRSKYASAEQLSPMETAIKTAQLAHVEAYRNKAAKQVYGLLNEAGEARLLKTTDMVREKQALLKNLKESKGVVTKLNRTIRVHKNQVNTLKKEITQLNRKGRNELSKNLKSAIKDMDAKSAGKDTLISDRQMMDALVSLESAELRKLRRMVEGRNSKLEPLFDRLEALNGELSDVYASRKGMWQQAQDIKTTVNKKNQTTMSFLDDGVENVAKIDPDIASAIHNWDKQSQNVMNEVLRFSNNVFKYGTTGANVGFALPNFVADQVGSAINSKSLMATHNPKNFIHSFFMAAGKPLNARDADILQGYLKGNAQQTSINQYTKQATARRAADSLVKKQGLDTSSGNIARDILNAAKKAPSSVYTMVRHPARDGMRTLFEGLENMVALTENVTRMQNYRGTVNVARKAGRTASDTARLANQAARENSVDFLEMGSYGRVVNSFIPYFNAAVQGNRILLRNIAERPVSSAGKITALVGAPLAATTVWNTSDPDRKAIYDTIPDYVKETNFIVITPNAEWDPEKKKWKGVVMMKKPPGVKEFAEPVRKFIEYKADDPKANLGDFLQDEGGSVAADFAQAMQPLDFSSPEKFLSSVTPQVMKPTAEAILNRNFFQEGDIVPESMQDLDPADQKYESYSQLTTHIAGMLNTSPLKVDHWIRQTFGEVGTNAQHYVDRLSGAPEEAIGGRSLPESVSRRFSSPSGGADTTAFWDSYGTASSARKRASSQVTSLVKAGRINEARRKAEEYNETISDRFSGFMSKYQDSPNYDPEWDERINSLKIPTTDQAFKARARQK